MKHLQKIIFVLPFVMGTLFMSCGSDDDSDPQDIPEEGTFTATVAEASTTNYVANTSKAVLTKNSVGGSVLYSFYVEGKESSTNRLMDFFIYSETEHVPGTFTINVVNSNQAYYIEGYETPNDKAWIAPDYSNLDPAIIYGTIKITELTSNRAKGSFSFTAREDGGSSLRTVTNGTFDVPLTRQGF